MKYLKFTLATTVVLVISSWSVNQTVLSSESTNPHTPTTLNSTGSGTIAKNCLNNIEEVNSTDLLETANFFNGFSKNVVSAKTFREQLFNVKQCANQFNYSSQRWQEAEFILNNMPDYEPVPESVKLTLQTEINDLLFKIREVTLSPQGKLLGSLFNDFIVINTIIITLGLSIGIILIPTNN